MRCLFIFLSIGIRRKVSEISIHAVKMVATVSDSWKSLNALKSFEGPFFALEFSFRFISAKDVPFSPADSSLRKILLLI